MACQSPHQVHRRQLAFFDDPHDGADTAHARIAAAAVLAAITAALFDWSVHVERSLGGSIGPALDVLDGRDG